MKEFPQVIFLNILGTILEEEYQYCIQEIICLGIISKWSLCLILISDKKSDKIVAVKVFFI